jgi:hypothetical protein
MELEYTLPFVAAAQLGSRAERGSLLRNVVTEHTTTTPNEHDENGREEAWALAWPLLQPIEVNGGEGVVVLPFTETAAALRVRAYQVCVHMYVCIYIVYILYM